MFRNRWFVRCMIVGMWIFLCSSCASTGNKQGIDEKQEGALHFQIGVSYLVKGNTEMAYFELGKAARLQPKNPDIHFALGTVHVAREDYQRALEEFKRTVRLDKEFADAYNNMGFVYFKLEQWDKAIEYCRKALDQISYQTPEKALYRDHVGVRDKGHHQAARRVRSTRLLGKRYQCRSVYVPGS